MKQLTPEIDQYRVRRGVMGSDTSYGMNGVFVIMGPRGIRLVCIVSNDGGWEHVSVERDMGSQISKKVPYWDEMCFIKRIFWTDEETVVQYHPREADYVNVHPSVLHLWRPTGEYLPTPPKIFV